MSSSANAGTPPIIPPSLPAPPTRKLGALGITAICIAVLMLCLATLGVVAVGILGVRMAKQNAPPPTVTRPQPQARPIRPGQPPPPQRAELVPATPVEAREFKTKVTKSEAGLTHKNDRMEKEPWSIHVLQVDRSQKDLGFFSAHARDKVLSVSFIADQARAVPSEVGRALGGVNGDFYVRDTPTYAGDPRGLQIVNGELISGPDTVCVWFDTDENPHLDEVKSDFAVTWPNGRRTPFGLNEQRQSKTAVLYTPTLGTSTRASGGRELILEKDGDGPWLPLQAGETYRARVRDISTTGNTRLEQNVMVLSLGPQMLAELPELKTGLTLQISTATTPDLKGVKAAIGGGPALIQNGKAFSQRTPPPGAGRSYSEMSKYQRHPRAAVGWSATHVYFVVADGRQPGLSMGMNLAELAGYMAGLGCTEAMNLDGGKSAQLWMSGRIMNDPCQGEDTVANSLLVVRKPQAR